MGSVARPRHWLPSGGGGAAASAGSHFPRRASGAAQLQGGEVVRGGQASGHARAILSLSSGCSSYRLRRRASRGRRAGDGAADYPRSTPEARAARGSSCNQDRGAPPAGRAGPASGRNVPARFAGIPAHAGTPPPFAELNTPSRDPRPSRPGVGCRPGVGRATPPPPVDNPSTTPLTIPRPPGERLTGAGHAGRRAAPPPATTPTAIRFKFGV